MPTSSRWLAVSSDLCFRYDSVYARPRRRDPRDRPRRDRDRDRDRDRPLRRLPRDRRHRPRSRDGGATATSSGCWRRQAWLQYRVSHLTHFPSQFWSKGAAQTQQVVRIIVLLKPESL